MAGQWVVSDSPKSPFHAQVETGTDEGVNSQGQPYYAQGQVHLPNSGQVSDVGPSGDGSWVVNDTPPAPKPALPPGVVKDADGRYDSAPLPSDASLYLRALFNPVGSGVASGISGGIEQVGGRAMQDLTAPILHPLKSLVGAADMIAHPINTGKQRIHEFSEEWDRNKPLAVENAVGDLLGMYEGGRAGAGAISGLRDIVPAPLRTAAVGDTDAAALRGLGVGPRSPTALNTLRSVQGARPYLRGAESLEDLQARVPVAKAEIWQPYQDAVEAIADKPVRGPDGMTTVGQLEADRAQTSALLRSLKSRNPEAIQLAQQKGLTEAGLLARERAIQAALDPELESTGIDPKAIRKTFGNVAQVGGRISGKSTLAENPQRYGLGKIANLSVERPLQAPTQIVSGLRDLVAGRPWWSGKPTDINLREAFSVAGEKPNLGQFRGVPFSLRPLQLESNVPGNAPYGDEPMIDGGTGPERPSVVTPPPLRPLILPEQTNAGFPSIVPRSSWAERLRSSGARTGKRPGIIQDERTFQDIAPPMPLRGTFQISPDGAILRGPAGMLPAPPQLRGLLPLPKDTPEEASAPAPRPKKRRVRR